MHISITVCMSNSPYRYKVRVSIQENNEQTSRKLQYSSARSGKKKQVRTHVKILITVVDNCSRRESLHSSLEHIIFNDSFERFMRCLYGC